MLLLLSTALAEPIPVTALETAAKITRVKVGVGAIFQAGGAFMDQPSHREQAGAAELLPFSAMGGLAPGIGASVDVRFFDIVGVEIDVLRSRDTAWSHYGVDGVDVPFRVSQPAWHVPILFKLHAPGPLLRPNIQLGAQVVLPIDTDLVVEGELPFELDAGAGAYSVWMAGLGLEVKLPIPGADIRIPLALRAGFNTPFSENATERALYALDADGYVRSMELETAWSYHAALTVGLTWYWPR